MGEIRSLEALWQEIRAGGASEQDRIDACFRTGEENAHDYAPLVVLLFEDPSELVRYYAVQSAVIDLAMRDQATLDLCWRLLKEDCSPDVRAMAATSLSQAYFDSRDSVVFGRLIRRLKDEESDYVRSALYSSLFRVLGKPVGEWPGVQKLLHRDRVFAVDWGKVAQLEDELDAAKKRSRGGQPAAPEA